MSGSKNVNSRTWSAVTIGIVLVAVAVAVIAYVLTGNLSTVLCTLLTVLGLFLAVMAVFRDGDNSGYGPSSRDTALVGGLVVLAFGVAGMVHIHTGSLTITAAVLIIVIAVAGVVMALKNRKV